MKNRISLNPFSIAWLLGAIAFFLILDSCAVLLIDYLTGYSSLFIHKTVKLFYVDLELNVPAFFSMLLLLIASLLVAIIAVLKRKEKAPFIFQWAILSIGFLFMAFDEIASIHERLIEPMRAILGEQNLGVLYFAWVVPVVPLVIFLGFFFVKFLWSLPAKTKLFFLIAATLYLGGAIGCELIESGHCEIYGKDNLPYMIMTTVEETLEMSGVIVFIWALLSYIAQTYGEVRLRFDNLESDS
jgi:hypothetical protein